MATSNTKPTRVLPTRIVQNFHLVWLDENIDENNADCRNSITQLRQLVNTVNTFIDVDECIDFITDTKQETTFMISSGTFGQTILPTIHDIQQVSTIYILSENKAQHEKWIKEWSQVKGVFADIKSICDTLKTAVQDCDQNAVSLSFAQSTSVPSSRNLDTLDCSFMYTQILKEILLTTDFEQSHINDFLTYCRRELAGNTVELRNVDKLQVEYHSHQPILVVYISEFSLLDAQ